VKFPSQLFNFLTVPQQLANSLPFPVFPYLANLRAVYTIAVARKRDATRSSPASAIVVRQQTKQGAWLRLRVTLATCSSSSTSSGRLILCLNQVVGFEPTSHSHNTSASSIAGYTTRPLLNNQNHGAFSDTASSLQTSHCNQTLLPVKVESSTANEHLLGHSATRPAEPTSLEDWRMPATKTTVSRCWMARDVQLAWAGRPDSATDRACNWHVNSKRTHSCATDDQSKLYDQQLLPEAFISYQDVNNCDQQLQQLLNCDSSYMTTAHSADQTAYLDLLNRNIAYEH